MFSCAPVVREYRWGVLWAQWKFSGDKHNSLQDWRGRTLFSVFFIVFASPSVAQFPTILQRLSARCLFIAGLSDIDTCFLYLTPTTWLSALFSTSYFGRSRHTYSSQQQALHVSHECRGIFVFWALFFLTEPYKFALYPTFSLLLCIYYKNIA